MKWKRFLAVSCSHGVLADKSALAAVLRFKERWKPDTTLHLGDAIDCTCFRAGAKGTNDESKEIEPDLKSGLDFLADLRPNIFMWGNHEDRLARLAQHHNAIISNLASRIVADITDECAKLKCRQIPWSYKQGLKLGNFTFCHGTIFTEFAARDMAEAYGNVCFGHAHRAAMATGRRLDCPTGVCTGHLMRPDLADYAKARKSTYAWSQGFCYGEYTDSRLVAWLHVQPQDQIEWRLPI